LRQESLTAKPVIRSLKALGAAEAACRRCELYRFATQVVPGKGPTHAPLMLVGEQPGNDEDLTGNPFVGPAGRVLDRALGDAGIERGKVFITNAVKHFKFEQRGKRRLHKRPNAHEIERCRWWSEYEWELVQPKLIVALGTTAARSIMGKPITIARVRGEVMTTPEKWNCLVTIHPSAILRMPDERDKAREYANFVADLKTCGKYAAG